MPPDGTDVRAIHVDADRDAIVVGVLHLVDVADRRRHHVDLARFEARDPKLAQRRAWAFARVARTDLRAAQHADEPPHRVVVHRRFLTGTPDEAHDTETLLRVAVQQVLLVVSGMGNAERLGKPVVFCDQLREARLDAFEQRAFRGFFADDRRDRVDESLKLVRNRAAPPSGPNCSKASSARAE